MGISWRERKLVKHLNQHQQIIIYGAGMIGEAVCRQLLEMELSAEIIGFAVSVATGTEQQICGFPVFSLAELVEYRKTAIVVLATRPKLHRALLCNLKKYGFPFYYKISSLLFDDMSATYMQHHGDIMYSDTVGESKIKILFCASDNNRTSGAFLSMVYLNRELIKMGVRTVVVLPVCGNGEDLLRQNSIPYCYVATEDWSYDKTSKYDIRYWIGKIRRLAQNKYAECVFENIIVHEKISVVHMNTTYTYIGAKAACKCHVPVVWHLRENMAEQGCWYLSFKRAAALINRSSYIISVSQFMKEQFPYLQEEKITVIYNGIDSKRFYVADKNSFTKPNIIILCVSAVYPPKGQMDLVYAAYQLREWGIESFEIWIVGTEEKRYAQVLRDKITELHVEDHIKFWGIQSNVKSFYEKADIGVICSREEPFGRVTIEGMLSGSLMIGTDSGATPELIRNEETGYLYPSGNGSALAGCIKKAMQNVELSREIAKRGQNSAIKEYSSETNAQKIYDIYRKIVAP